MWATRAKHDQKQRRNIQLVTPKEIDQEIKNNINANKALEFNHR